MNKLTSKDIEWQEDMKWAVIDAETNVELCQLKSYYPGATEIHYQVEREEQKLRLDYFLSLGLKLSEGDLLQSANGERVTLKNDIINALNIPRRGGSNRFVLSFAPRKNTGEQPCDGEVVVCVTTPNGGSTDSAVNFDWRISRSKYNIETWKPDLEELIKMQDEHDNEAKRKSPPVSEIKAIIKSGMQKGGSIRNAIDGSDEIFGPEPSEHPVFKFTDESSAATATLKGMGYTWSGGEQWKPPLGDAPEYITNPIYTQEMHDKGELPSVGMGFICDDDIQDSRIGDFHKKEVTVIGVYYADGYEVITFNHKNLGIGCGVFDECWVKPADTRTKEQKQTAEVLKVLGECLVFADEIMVKRLRDAGLLRELS